ncbi:MAG: hypothetical protein RLZZ196_482 [Bacteroidota bacterium]|jgi:hypothetical protein
MKYLVVLFLVFFTILASAQAPQRMSYQAVIRNSNNTLVSQQLIGVRISILQADTAGQAVYIETHYTKTNLNGLMTLQIGGGLKFFGDFSSIDWSSGHYYIKTETDPDGGFDYRITGYSELLSVPYALYASNKTANNSVTKADLDSTHYFDINLQGNISASKNVTVKGNIEALGSTSTLGTIEKPFKGLFLSAGSLSIASDTLGQNIPAAVLSNVAGNLQISAGGVKLMGENTSFIAPRIVGALTGNASTATKLAATKTINGVAFDGSADILISSVADAGTLSGTTLKSTILNSSLTSVGTLANLTVTNPISGSVTGNAATATYATIAGTLSGTIPIWNQSTTGNAATASYAISAGTASSATKLETPRTINNIPFDGTTNITIATTSPNSLTYSNSGTGEVPGGAYDGSIAKTISYNSIGASPSAGSSLITTIGTLTTGSIPFTLLTGTIPTWNQSTTGNAATATKLAATKTINGVAFDGSADILISAVADAGTLSGTTLKSTILNSSLTSVGILANLTVTNPISGSVTGNAATATHATTAGTLSGTIPTWNQSTTGNAATATYATSAGTASTATKLATSKNINNVAFDGSADIFITAVAEAGTLSGTTLNSTITHSSLTSVGTIATGTWSASTIDIAHGGTNSSATPTAGGIVYGNGTAHEISSAGNSGQYLQSAGSGTPIWAQPGPTSIQVLTTSGTYSPSSGVKAIIVELVGAGGGSGAIASAGGNNNGTVSGGGGSGAYTRAIIVNPASSYTYIIGLGGTASAVGVAGGNGGATSFNAGTITAPGGSGGGIGSVIGNGTISLGGNGGVAGIGGSFMVSGHAGGTGFSSSVLSVAGSGANSYFGDGGSSPAVIDGSSVAGVAGNSYGAGASGAAAMNFATGAVGAAGYHGVIIVTEYK